MHRGIVVATALLVCSCADGGGQQTNGFMVLPPGQTGNGLVGQAGMTAAAGTGASGVGGPRSGTGGMGVGPDRPLGGSGASGVGAMGTSGTGGTGAGGMNSGASGAMAGGTGGMGAGGTGGSTPPPPPGSMTPIIPEVTADCPEFRNGTITFMGLGGIAVQAGSKASGPTAPMIWYWHGTGSFSGEYAGMAGAVHQGAMQEGGVLISFQGTTGGDLLSGTAIFGRGDFELADQLTACAVKNHNVDPRRIFATGCSAGGLFSGAMAAARSNYMAAAAPNSGGWTTPVQFQNDWTPALMTVHGAAGRDVVIIDFSNSSRTADTAFSGRGGFVINCDHGGGHCGGGGLAPDIWEFFKAHPYGTKPSPWEGGLPSGFNSDCKIFGG
jgi:hypothetical protein